MFFFFRSSGILTTCIKLCLKCLHISLNRSFQSQVYTLMIGSQKISLYCHMGNFGCGDGGWTLAMKIDGTKVVTAAAVAAAVVVVLN